MYQDAHVVDHANDVFDLLGINNIFRQVVVDFGIGEETLLLAFSISSFSLDCWSLSIVIRRQVECP